MRLNLIILIVIGLITLGWLAYGYYKTPVDQKNLQTNSFNEQILEQAPDFEYVDILGRRGSLYAHKGKPILLHFWATWCTPCLVEFPDIIQLAQNQKDNLTILAVSSDVDKNDIELFIKKMNKSIPVNLIITMDKDKEITQDLYQTYKLPESYLISKNLGITDKIIGPQENWNDENWQKRIISLKNQ